MKQKIQQILIVEDEPALISALRIKLEMAGYKVHLAPDGEAGLKASTNLHPDLILLDIIMPKMDGLTMLAKLREDKWGETAKIMLLTNLSDEKKAMAAVQHGVYDYLVKTDWKIDDVLEKVKSRLNQ